MKCKDLKQNEIYMFKKILNDSTFIAKVVSEGKTYFKTQDIYVIKGLKSVNKQLLRGFDNDSLKKYIIKKIDINEYPEYYI